MNYTRIPSLEQTALVKIAISLWCQEDIQNRWREFALPIYADDRRLKTYEREWEEIENEVKENVAKLPNLLTTREVSTSREISVFPNDSLEVFLKQSILNIIPPIGREILNWKLYHEHEYLGVGVPNEFHWTFLGTIDTTKTAVALVRNENLNVIQRYKIACIYCITEHIQTLWNSIPENSQFALLDEEYLIVEPMQDLITAWAHIVDGDHHKLYNSINKRRQRKRTIHQYCFKRAVCSANKTATEYFFNRLTSPQEMNSLLITAKCAMDEYKFRDRGLPADYYADVLCFLFSQMEKEQRMKICTPKASDILMICLLKWPKQHHFLETLNCMWDYISLDTYKSAWRSMRDEILAGSKDYNYRKLFREFWRQTPYHVRSQVIDDCAKDKYILSSLVESDDIEHLSLLRDATVFDREKIIFQRKDVCETLVYGDKLIVFELLLKMCIPSQSSMMKFKAEFYEYITRERSRKMIYEEKDIWSKGYNLLNNLIQKYDCKRARYGIRL